MATMAMSIIEREQHTDEGTDETSTTDSCMEELEVPIKNVNESVEPNNDENKEETEDPIKLAEEIPEKEVIVPNGKIEIEIPEKEDDKNSEGNSESLSPFSEDTEEDENNHKKSEMITLPFKADENESEKSEMIKLSIGEEVEEEEEEEEKKEEPVKKPRSRKQEIVTLNDVENVRGILPDYDTSVVYEIISQLPIIRRCIIEHSYFQNQLYNSNLYDLTDLLRNDPNRTLENKRAEETIESECLSVESLDTSSDPSDLLQQSARSSVASERNYGDLSESDEESVISAEEMAKYRIMSQDRRIPIVPKPPKLIKIGESVSVSFDEIDKELSEMEKMIKKRKEMQMPGLTRIGNSVKGRNVDIPLQMPNLKKMGEIKHTDIDEILARVSEMNAKNLTKALEREKFKEEGGRSADDSPTKIKVKTVENINEELKKKEIENRTIFVREPERNSEDGRVVKKFLMPVGCKPTEPPDGTFYRVLNSGSSGTFFQLTNKGRPVKPKVPGLVYAPNRPINKKTVPDNKPPLDKAVFPVKSIEQKIIPPPTNTRFVKLVPYEPEKLKIETKKPEVRRKPEVVTKLEMPTKAEPVKKLETSKPEVKKQVSLYTFSNILKTILPENWLVSMEPRYGLQILKTHMDSQLNPALMISVVVGRCGKIRINIRGRQLDKSHEIFSNIGSVSNSEGKMSVFYVLSLIEKLKMYSVCCGCDDPSLEKYWTDDGLIEFYTEHQKTFRSHSCELLIHLNKKRCYTCHRLNEKLKKRQRRDQLEKKESAAAAEAADLTTNEIKEISEIEKQYEVPTPEKSLKRNFEEEFIEESFSSMKRQITDEIEKRKVDATEKVPKTQEEVLSFMGLARKDTLEQNSVRKSKREKKYFQKFEPNDDIAVSQSELDFLEKYWSDINTLFSTSLLFGAYSRTGVGRLRTKCMMFHKILKKWQKIIRDNPDWIGTDLIIYDQTLERDETEEEIFKNMDIEDLRKYLMNSVKEVGKVKCRLKTKNTYFKCLYNKFVKRRAKRQKKEQSGNSIIENTDESSREKDEKFISNSSGNQDIFMEYVSDGE